MSLREKMGKSGLKSGPRSKTRDDRITLTLHTDRAHIGDEFRALKQVLGRSGSRAMAKNQYFAHVLEEKSGKSWHISRPSAKTTWDRITNPLHTDRALIGDVFRALKHVLGWCESSDMAKMVHFCVLVVEKQWWVRRHYKMTKSGQKKSEWMWQCVPKGTNECQYEVRWVILLVFVMSCHVGHAAAAVCWWWVIRVPKTWEIFETCVKTKTDGVRGQTATNNQRGMAKRWH